MAAGAPPAGRGGCTGNRGVGRTDGEGGQGILAARDRQDLHRQGGKRQMYWDAVLSKVKTAYLLHFAYCDGKRRNDRTERSTELGEQYKYLYHAGANV